MKNPFSHYPLRRRRSGSVIGVVAGGMIALLAATAMSVDYGMLVMDANRLQRGCDAGALAGAAKLKATGVLLSDNYNAIVEAQRVAFQNGVSVNASDVVIDSDGKALRVSSNTRRAFFFGPAIGISSGRVARSAKAGVKATSKLTTQGPIRVAPIGITIDTYDLYKNDRLFTHSIELVRQNKTVFDINDMVLFDLRDNNAKSPAAMQDQLEGNANEETFIGDEETTLNAAGPAQIGKLEDGIKELMDKSAREPWNDNNSSDGGKLYNEIVAGTTPRDNPRIVYLIVTPRTTNPKNGTFDTVVKGFVPVYIDGYTETSGNGGGNNAETGFKLNIRFLPPSVASDTGMPTDPEADLTGIRSVSLEE